MPCGSGCHFCWRWYSIQAAYINSLTNGGFLAGKFYILMQTLKELCTSCPVENNSVLSIKLGAKPLKRFSKLIVKLIIRHNEQCVKWHFSCMCLHVKSISFSPNPSRLQPKFHFHRDPFSKRSVIYIEKDIRKTLFERGWYPFTFLFIEKCWFCHMWNRGEHRKPFRTDRCVYYYDIFPANTKRNKRVIITTKQRFDVMITCLLRCVFAGLLYSLRVLWRISKIYVQLMPFEVFMSKETLLPLNSKQKRH